MNRDILKNTDQYYSDRITRFGTTSRGVDWNSEKSQRTRFDQLSKIFSRKEREGFSVCDYGCGYGEYADYLKEKGYLCDYTGIDISKKMIEAAERKYGTRGGILFIHDSELKQTYDYIIASGIFNVSQNATDHEWTSYMMEILEMFHKHSRKGFAFNSLTTYSDPEYMKEYLHYASPTFYFDYVKKNFSGNVALLHDYGLYEFTILVRKESFQ